MIKYEALLEEHGESLKRLDEALREQKTGFTRDSAIKRFELAFDLAWKSIKTFLEARGISCNSPISCFREAYREGVIGLEDVWIDMVKTRNKTAYVYNEILAEETFGELPRILEALNQLLSKLREN